MPEIKNFQHNYSVKGFADNVLKIDAQKVNCNTEVLRIVCDLIFKEMKILYPNMSYLKISVLVPSRNINIFILFYFYIKK